MGGVLAGKKKSQLTIKKRCGGLGVSCVVLAGLVFCFGVSAPLAPLLQAGFRAGSAVWVPLAVFNTALQVQRFLRVPRQRKIARRTKMRCAVLLSVGYRRNGRRRNADRNKTLALRFGYCWWFI